MQKIEKINICNLVFVTKMGVIYSRTATKDGANNPCLSVSDEGVNMPGLSVSNKGVFMPGLSVSDKGVFMPGLSVSNEEVNITNTSVINKKNNWFDFLTNIFYPFFSYNTRIANSTHIVNPSCTYGYSNSVSIHNSSINSKNHNIISINGNKFVVVTKNNLIYINDIATDIKSINGKLSFSVDNDVIYINGNKIDSKKYI